MPFNRRKNCETCIQIILEAKGKPVLRSRLYKLINDHHLKGRTLTEIAQAYPSLRYESIQNHASKHQAPTDKAMRDQKQKQVMKAEKHKALVAQRTHHERRNKLLNWIESEIDAGHVKPTAAAIVALLKQEADIEEKQKDRNVDILRIMTSARSGEITGYVQTEVLAEPFDPWQQDQ